MNTERLMELKEKYGTPLQIYDTDMLKEKMHTFLKSFQTDGIETGVIYASKAFNCKAMLRMVNEEGLYLDVVSGGELYTAKQVDFPMDRIFFHGNNKTLAELEMAKEYGVKYIVCDNAMEAEVIDELWKDAEKEVHVLLRLNPGITAHTHEYIVTAHVDSKFGIALEDKEELMGIINMFQKNEKIIFEGFHSHIGSQIFEAKAYEALIEKLMSYVKELRDVYAIEVSMLNLGGGFAAYYTEEDAPIPIEEACKTILTCFKKEEEYLQTGIKKLMIEPGRSIVAEAGIMIYSIGYQKKTPNKNYLFVDGGMSDSIRPALYQAKYEAYLLGKENVEKEITYTVAGKCCESGDILIQEIDLPKAERGDALVMKTTGAYGYAMASHYNKLPLVAVVFANEEKDQLVIRRETYAEMIALEE